jgi:hypothetical protein
MLVCFWRESDVVVAATLHHVRGYVQTDSHVSCALRKQSLISAVQGFICCLLIKRALSVC